jgi:peptide/nickel transport system ATP-binding protein
VVADMADRVAVMRHGHILESGTTSAVLGNPNDSYTRALIAAVPHGESALAATALMRGPWCRSKA